MLIVVVEDMRGALVTERELVDGQLNIGRTEENDIVLPSNSVSRQHACLYIENKIAYVADMGSSNGVFVDDRKIKSDTEVGDHSRIRVGEYRIVLEKLVNPSTQESGIKTAVVLPERAHGKLVLMSGRQAGREILLYEPMVTVGRVDENDVSLPDISISRHHARIQHHGEGAYTLTDLESSNGTFIDGRRLSNPARIRHGERIQFGNVEALLADTMGLVRGRKRWSKLLLYAALIGGAAFLGVVMSFMLVK